MARQYGLIQRPKTLFEQARDRRRLMAIRDFLGLCVFCVFLWALLVVT